MPSKQNIFSLIALFFTISLSGQELYIPRVLKEAYQNKTRDKNGKPGENYWQNKASYTIKMDVTPPNPIITGSEKITYTNNSPDTLRKVNFKLILNHHKPVSPRTTKVSKDYLTSGVHIDKFMENGERRNWHEKPNGRTNKIIKLSQPLFPEDTVNFKLKWHYKLSKGKGREGVVKDSTFFVGYFYPRIAVYDDYIGWDETPHTMGEEFYNDFSDYTFKITVPKNFIIWATGKLQNPNEVLSRHYANLFKTSKVADSVVHIITQKDLDDKIITQQNPFNTWKWKANNLTDIAFAISNSYKWEAGSVKLDNGNGKRVSIQVAFDDESKDFKKMFDYAKHTVDWFSTIFPAEDYPYAKISVVRGFGDMEFPMMANINSNPANPELSSLTAHEIAHTYFPFFTGINETRFGFMDEGWAVMMEYFISLDNLSDVEAVHNFKNYRIKRWIKNPSYSADLPIIIPSNMLRGRARWDNAYGKTALAYLALRDLLGPQFKKVLKQYMNRWSGHHPTPWDFFYSFNDLTNQNLNWFWKRWFFERNYIDIGIENVEIQQDKVKITLKNKGGFPIPFDIKAKLSKDKIKTFHQTPEVWETDKKQIEIELNHITHIISLSLDTGIFMDADTSDNKWNR